MVGEVPIDSFESRRSIIEGTARQTIGAKASDILIGIINIMYKPNSDDITNDLTNKSSELLVEVSNLQETIDPVGVTLLFSGIKSLFKEHTTVCLNKEEIDHINNSLAESENVNVVNIKAGLIDYLHFVTDNADFSLGDMPEGTIH